MWPKIREGSPFNIAKVNKSISVMHTLCCTFKEFCSHHTKLYDVFKNRNVKVLLYVRPAGQCVSWPPELLKWLNRLDALLAMWESKQLLKSLSWSWSFVLQSLRVSPFCANSDIYSTRNKQTHSKYYSILEAIVHFHTIVDTFFAGWRISNAARSTVSHMKIWRQTDSRTYSVKTF